MDEFIQIGPNIRVVVIGIKRGQEVRLGIEAPKDVTVHREEVQKRIEAALTRLATRSKSVLSDDKTKIP